jgi:hypothetical protein
LLGAAILIIRPGRQKELAMPLPPYSVCVKEQCKIIMEYHDVLEASRNTGTDPATETWCCINKINFNTVDNGKSPETSVV